jgi:phosphatidate cytidylyltransferase
VTTRIVTGAVIGVVALVLVWHGGLAFFIVMLALALLGLNEFYRLMRLYKPLPLPGFAGAGLMLYMAWFRSPFGVMGAIALSVFLIALVGLLIGPRRGVTARMAVTLLGVLYLGLGFSALLLLRRLDGGGLMVGAVIFGTWAGDTMAYFTGKYFGANPMAPVLSPKKTWEGLAGGAVGTILLVVFVGLYIPDQVQGWGPGQSLLLGAVIAVVGPLGDLFESLLKRDVQIKDSGRGLPGHGGLLDRFDALLWAAVAAYFLLTAVLGVGG